MASMTIVGGGGFTSKFLWMLITLLTLGVDGKLAVRDDATYNVTVSEAAAIANDMEADAMEADDVENIDTMDLMQLKEKVRLLEADLAEQREKNKIVDNLDAPAEKSCAKLAVDKGKAAKEAAITECRTCKDFLHAKDNDCANIKISDSESHDKCDNFYDGKRSGFYWYKCVADTSQKTKSIDGKTKATQCKRGSVTCQNATVGTLPENLRSQYKTCGELAAATGDAKQKAEEAKCANCIGLKLAPKNDCTKVKITVDSKCKSKNKAEKQTCTSDAQTKCRSYYHGTMSMTYWYKCVQDLDSTAINIPDGGHVATQCKASHTTCQAA